MFILNWSTNEPLFSYMILTRSLGQGSFLSPLFLPPSLPWPVLVPPSSLLSVIASPSSSPFIRVSHLLFCHSPLLSPWFGTAPTSPPPSLTVAFSDLTWPHLLTILWCTWLSLEVHCGAPSQWGMQRSGGDGQAHSGIALSHVCLVPWLLCLCFLCLLCLPL